MILTMIVILMNIIQFYQKFQHYAEHICIAGDMNTELTRQNSWHTNGIKWFVTDESLYFTHEYPTSNIEYSYFNTTYTTFTIIDHFIVTKHLLLNIIV